MNKEQIKVDELPKDWLLLDQYVESGNVDFIENKVSDQMNCEIPEHQLFHMPAKGGGRVCMRCVNNRNKTTSLGTKHIQLFAANPIVLRWKDGSYSFAVKSMPMGSLTEKECLLGAIREEQGKDFFIYKVSEEK